MELVSANTKNYLFLTMSQYNDQDKLVRARVSMRRDQPFWEGGNSFIACESFRITAAPNAGGLYYNILEKDQFIGCVEDKSSHANNPTFVAQTGFAPPGYQTYTDANTHTDRLPDKLVAFNVKIAGDAFSCDLAVSAPAAGGLTTPALDETRQEDILPRFSRYFGSHRITKNTMLQFQDDANANTLINVLTSNVPLESTIGCGGGQSGLFFPKVRFETPAHAFNEIAAGDPGFGSDISLRIFPAPEGAKYSGTFIDDVFQMLGRGAWLALDGGPTAAGGILTSKPKYPEGFFQFLAPYQMEVDIVDAKTGGEWNGPVYWNSKTYPLIIGDPVWMMLDDGQGQGNLVRKDGAVIAHPMQMFNRYTDHLIATMDIKVIAGVDAAGAPLYNQAVLSDNYFLTCSSENVSQQIRCSVSGRVTAWTPTTAQVPGPNPPGGNITVNVPATNTSGKSAVVGFAQADSFGSKIIQRGVLEQTTIYTPNELFYTFNKPTGVEDTPWQLQTDENGGFVIQWAPPKQNDIQHKYKSFFISKALSDSLGLNDYIEYIGEPPSTASTEYFATCINKTAYRSAQEEAQTFQEFCIDVPVTQLQRVDGGMIDPRTIDVGGGTNSTMELWGSSVLTTG